MLLVAGFFVVHWVEAKIIERQSVVQTVWFGVPAPVRGYLAAFAMLLVVAFAGQPSSYIYFRF